MGEDTADNRGGEDSRTGEGWAETQQTAGEENRNAKREKERLSKNKEKRLEKSRNKETKMVSFGLCLRFYNFSLWVCWVCVIYSQ